MKIFDTISVKKPEYSAFDLSHERKQSMQFGRLTPCLLEEVVPGDDFKIRTETLVRLQPMIAPIMERIDIYIHYFFVPNRITWDSWEDFITGGDKGDLAPSPPQAHFGTVVDCGKGTLADYFGLPTRQDAGDPTNKYWASLLPFYAYYHIWNDYYRDEQLQDKVDPTNTSQTGYFSPNVRSWGKDYFTSALPTPQKGPAVTVPISGTGGGTVNYKDVSTIARQDGSLPAIGDLSSGTALGGNALETGGAANAPSRVENIDSLNVTLDQVGLTIEELRRSSRLQEWLELANRGGSRLVELIKNYFGVHTGDARLQRPEYLGGGKTPITISEVLNTTGVIDAQGSPQGTMAGHGIASGANNNMSYKVKEHGYIMGIASIMPQSTYSQGVQKHWNRLTKFDYYWPQFANIGEQTVDNKELYHDFDTAAGGVNDDAFGYQQRYAEYKYRSNSVHGEFKTNLAFWTLARKFANVPNLNEEFITCDDAELQNIFAVSGTLDDKFLVQMYHNIKARRPMPYFSRPEL